MRKTIILGLFFSLLPLTLAFSFLFLIFISSEKKTLSASFNKLPKVVYAAVPNSNDAMSLNVEATDARVTAVENFFVRYKSPLTPYALEVVTVADKYGLDYKLIPAIAMQESTLCKNIIKDSYNCWGFGIYGKNVTRFDNYSQAIDVVTKTLANQYKAAGLETPEQIMAKYNPVSKGTWAIGVSSFMDQLSINL